jgi:hypothetical protein
MVKNSRNSAVQRPCSESFLDNSLDIATRPKSLFRRSSTRVASITMHASVLSAPEELSTSNLLVIAASVSMEAGRCSSISKVWSPGLPPGDTVLRLIASVFQTALTEPCALIKSATDARQTKASMSVYSTRSCPAQSSAVATLRQRKIVIFRSACRLCHPLPSDLLIVKTCDADDFRPSPEICVQSSLLDACENYCPPDEETMNEDQKVVRILAVPEAVPSQRSVVAFADS